MLSTGRLHKGYVIHKKCPPVVRPQKVVMATDLEINYFVSKTSRLNSSMRTLLISVRHYSKHKETFFYRVANYANLTECGTMF